MTTQNLMSVLEKLEAAAKEATPGPWAYEQTGLQSNEWHLGVVIDENEQELSGLINLGQGEVVELVCSNESATDFKDAEFIALANPATILALTQSLRLAVGALGESAKLIHFFPPTHLFQDGSDAHELQSRAIEVYQSHCKALSSIQQLGLGEGGK